MFRKSGTNEAEKNTISYNQDIIKEMYDMKRELRENDEQIKYFVENGEILDKKYLEKVAAEFYKVEILIDLKKRCLAKDSIISNAFDNALDKMIENHNEGKDFTNSDVKTIEKILKALGIYKVEETYSTSLGARFYEGGRRK